MNPHPIRCDYIPSCGRHVSCSRSRNVPGTSRADRPTSGSVPLLPRRCAPLTQAHLISNPPYRTRVASRAVPRAAGCRRRRLPASSGAPSCGVNLHLKECRSRRPPSRCPRRSQRRSFRSARPVGRPLLWCCPFRCGRASVAPARRRSLRSPSRRLQGMDDPLRNSGALEEHVDVLEERLFVSR